MYYKQDMKILLIWFLLLWLPFYNLAQNITISGSEYDIPTSMALFHDGSIGLLGFSKSSEEYNDQVFMVKCSNTGEIIWEKFHGGIYGDRPYDLCISDDDKITITGETWNGFGSSWGRENLFVIQLNSYGDIDLQKTYYQYHKDMGLRIKTLDNGHFLVNGFTKSSDDAYGDMMITKLDAYLDIIWQTVVGEELSIDYGFEVIPNDAGYLAIGSVGGFFNSNMIDFVTPQSDILVAQLNHDGELLWKQHYGGPGHDWLEKAAVINNEIYLVGSTQSIGSGSFDILLMKMSMEGDSIYSKTYGDIYYNQGRAISFGNNRIFLGGVTKKENSSSASANYIIATDLEGEILWERVIESTGSDKLKDLEFNHQTNTLYCLSSSYSESTGIDFWLYTLNEDGQFAGISTLTRNELRVVPNPIKDDGYIQLPNENHSLTELFIYNLNGQIVHQEISQMSHHQYPFTAKGLIAGFYTFKIILEDGRQYTGKFMVY